MKAIYEELLRKIPDYKEFLTAQELDESSFALAKEYPDVVSVFPFGETKEGRTLQCMKISGGKHVALMFGCPHPNEPIGTMMLEYFTRALAENKALRDELFYPQIGVKPCSMAGGGVSKNIWNCFRTAPEGTGQPLTCSTSGMGLRLK